MVVEKGEKHFSLLFAKKRTNEKREKGGRYAQVHEGGPE